MARALDPKPDHWYAETPVMIEALAETVHTSIPDVCEHLEASVIHEELTEPGAVMRFVDEYVAAG